MASTRAANEPEGESTRDAHPKRAQRCDGIDAAPAGPPDWLALAPEVLLRVGTSESGREEPAAQQQQQQKGLAALVFGTSKAWGLGLLAAAKRTTCTVDLASTHAAGWAESTRALAWHAVAACAHLHIKGKRQQAEEALSELSQHHPGGMRGAKELTLTVRRTLDLPCTRHPPRTLSPAPLHFNACSCYAGSPGHGAHPGWPHRRAVP